MPAYSELKELSNSLGAEVLENEPMILHTTFKIGGPADIFITPGDIASLEKIYLFCEQKGIPLLITGNGSNLLVSDSGIRGAVLRLGEGCGEFVAQGSEVTCGTGAALSELCLYARDLSLTGAEFAYGIPGTVGGAVCMNAGAYGGEMKDIIVKVHHVGPAGKGVFEGKQLGFSYRKSVYSGGGMLITKVVFKFEKGVFEKIDGRMQELMRRRKLKQPLELPSAGSVFKRPSCNYASALIEQCGLKGLRAGGAVVSEKHAGFIVNTGGATCDDVLKLIERVQSEVYKKTGIELEREIKYVGS